MTTHKDHSCVGIGGQNEHPVQIYINPNPSYFRESGFQKCSSLFLTEIGWEKILDYENSLSKNEKNQTMQQSTMKDIRV